MRDLMKSIAFLAVSLLCITLTTGCGTMPDQMVTAEVLSVDDNILEGKMMGAFLGGASGSIANDVIKVGVKFQYRDKLYLLDLRLNHAELAYYKDRNTLDLRIKDWDVFDDRMCVYLNQRIVASFYILL